MRGDHRTGMRCELPARIVRRLGGQHVEADTCQPAGVERLQHGGGLHQAAARSVDQQCRRLHLGQPLRVDQVPGLVVQGGVQRDHVGIGQQLLQAHLLDASAAVPPRHDVGPDHPHPEGAGPLRHRRADQTAADDAVGDFGEPAQRHGLGVVPAAGGRRATEHADPPQQAHRQRDRVVGDLRSAVVGHVRDPDAPLGGRGHIDAVHPDAIADHQPNLGQRVQHLGGDRGVLVDQRLRTRLPRR